MIDYICLSCTLWSLSLSFTFQLFKSGDNFLALKRRARGTSIYLCAMTYIPLTTKCEAILFARIDSCDFLSWWTCCAKTKLSPQTVRDVTTTFSAPHDCRKFISRMPNLGLHDTANNSAHPIALHSFLYVRDAAILPLHSGPCEYLLSTS